jgi:hypothetical protein
MRLMLYFIWVPSEMQGSILIVLITITVLLYFRELSFPLLFKLGRRGNSRLQKDLLSAYFITVSMHAKNTIILCQILEEVQ